MSDDNSGCSGILALAGIVIGIYLIVKLVGLLFQGVILLCKVFVFAGFNFLFFIDSLMFINSINPILLWGAIGLIIGSFIGVVVAIKKYRLSSKLVLYPLTLIVIAMTILSFINRPLKYNTAHYQSDFAKVSKPLESAGTDKSGLNEADVRAMLGLYTGTIGKKVFKLAIEKFEGEDLSGYNVTGDNKRPVKGKILRKWRKEKDGRSYTIYNLVLSEPGDDKWDGEFDIDIWISGGIRIGEGVWKAYNGKLDRDIKITEGKKK